MLTLSTNELQLWLADIETITCTKNLVRCQKLLSEEEQQRAKRFYFPRHRQRFVLTRGIIRLLLSRFVPEVNPDTWEFKINDYGKPAIADPLPPFDLHFNISHSQHYLAIVVGSVAEMGVDVEVSKPGRQLTKIARRYFSAAEFAALCGLAPELQTQRFYALWTLKEAYIKACGLGLAIPLSHFSFEFGEGDSIGIQFDWQRQDNEELWRFWQFQDSETTSLALALKSENSRDPVTITCRRLSGLDDYSRYELPLPGSAV
jgi:4'-phosphopantetheinyl transferase